MSAVLQFQAGSQIVGSATPSYAFGASVSAGSLLVPRLSSNATFAVNSITDTVGTPYKQIILYTAQGLYLAVHAGIAPRAGANTVQWNLSASVNTRPALMEAAGWTATLDGVPQGWNGPATQNPMLGPFVTKNFSDLILALIHCGTVATGPPAPWVQANNGVQGNAYQIADSLGPFNTAYHTGSTAVYVGVILAFTSATVAGIVTPSDNSFTLLAKSNRPLGGTGITPNDNEFTMYAKIFRLLGGAGANANGTVFSLLARINQQLGGPGTTPSDNIFTLLARQNLLLGGSGATPSDTVFTLLAKNSQLLHH